MDRRDKVTLALLGFFFVVATTIELYFVVAHRTLPEAASAGNTLAYLLSIYGPSDQAYFARPSAFALSLEGLNVFVTQPLGLVLAYAIVKQRPWRWPLQLAVGAYLAYSVVLYFLVAHVSHFASMSEKSPRTFIIFYAANAPWLLGYAWMALDAAREIAARFTTVEDRPPSASPAWWRSHRYS
jgi:EXPERA (EXPanded EBP superfamily)